MSLLLLPLPINIFAMRRISYLMPLLMLICCQPPDGEQINDQTAFDQPPQWASEVVWYQIFVERFRNGDPSNDPTPADLEGSYPGFVPESWEVTPWTQDWYSDDGC